MGILAGGVQEHAVQSRSRHEVGTARPVGASPGRAQVPQTRPSPVGTPLHGRRRVPSGASRRVHRRVLLALLPYVFSDTQPDQGLFPQAPPNCGTTDALGGHSA